MFKFSAIVAKIFSTKTVQLSESHCEIMLYRAVMHIQKQFTPCTPAATIAASSVARAISFLSGETSIEFHAIDVSILWEQIGMFFNTWQRLTISTITVTRWKIYMVPPFEGRFLLILQSSCYTILNRCINIRERKLEFAKIICLSDKQRYNETLT